jgi:prophage antirepressor-like protein
MSNTQLPNATSVLVFNNPQFGDVRTAGTSEQPLFCLADVCKAVGIANNRNVRNRLDQEDVHQMDTLTKGGLQSMAYVTEAGMYDVILRSDSSQAKPFRKWVTSEVLPAIRRTGGYMAAAPAETPEQIMARALLVAQDTIERSRQKLAVAEKTIEEQRGAVLFTNSVKTSESSILVGELATILKQNGVEVGQNRLFGWLRLNGYLCAHGERYNLPTQRSLDMGLVEIKKTSINKPDGTILVTTTPKVTGKGQIYFVNKFLNETTNVMKGATQ